MPSQRKILAQMVIAMAGRAAEVVHFRRQTSSSSTGELDVTTGAASDLEKARRLAREHARLFGGAAMPPTSEESQFLSSEADINHYVERMVSLAQANAIELVEKNLDVFDTITRELLKSETLSEEYLDAFEL